MISLPIYVTGDSHIGLFYGEKGFVVGKNTPATAYNLCAVETESNGYRYLFDFLETVPKGGTVMMSYGEIDCRNHIVRLHKKTGRPMEDLADEIARRYAGVVSQVKGMGYEVIVWGVVPPTCCPTYPHMVGSLPQRLAATAHLNAAYVRHMAPLGVPVVSIFERLLLPNGLTNPQYMSDGFHLKKLALPLALAAIRAVCPPEVIEAWMNMLPQAKTKSTYSVGVVCAKGNRPVWALLKMCPVTEHKL